MKQMYIVNPTIKGVIENVIIDFCSDVIVIIWNLGIYDFVTTGSAPYNNR